MIMTMADADENKYYITLVAIKKKISLSNNIIYSNSPFHCWYQVVSFKVKSKQGRWLEQASLLVEAAPEEKKKYFHCTSGVVGATDIHIINLSFTRIYQTNNHGPLLTRPFIDYRVSPVIWKAMTLSHSAVSSPFGIACVRAWKHQSSILLTASTLMNEATSEWIFEKTVLFQEIEDFLLLTVSVGFFVPHNHTPESLASLATINACSILRRVLSKFIMSNQVWHQGVVRNPPSKIIFCRCYKLFSSIHQTNGRMVLKTELLYARISSPLLWELCSPRNVIPHTCDGLRIAYACILHKRDRENAAMVSA